MKYDLDLEFSGVQLREIMCQLKYVYGQILRGIPEKDRLKAEDKRNHPLHSLKMSIYWLGQLDAFQKKTSGETPKKGSNLVK